MKYISRMAGGYLVRKRRQGQPPEQVFFGDSAHGGEAAAKRAAIAYRDRYLMNDTGPAGPDRRYRNIRNRTGIVGIAWYRQRDTRSGFRQSFRARVADPEAPGGTRSRAWSIQIYGLWGAYREAALWRHRHLNPGKAANEAEIAEHFDHFLDRYFNELTTNPAIGHYLRAEAERLVENGAIDPLVRARVRQRLHAPADQTETSP